MNSFQKPDSRGGKNKYENIVSVVAMVSGDLRPRRIADLMPKRANPCGVQRRNQAGIGSLLPGEEFLKKGEFEAAAAEFQTSLGISPRPRVYYRLAQVQNRLNQAEQAMESLNQALKLSPGFREAQVFRQQLITQGYGAQPAREGQPDATVLAPPPAKTLVSEPTVETVSPEAKAEIPAADRTSVTFAETPEPEAPESEAGSVSTPASVIEPSASPEEPASPR